MAFTFIDDAKKEDGRLAQPTPAAGPAGLLEFIEGTGLEVPESMKSRITERQANLDQTRNAVENALSTTAAMIQSIPSVGEQEIPTRRFDEFRARMSGTYAAQLKAATGSPPITSQQRAAMLSPLMGRFNDLLKFRNELNQPSEFESEMLSEFVENYGEHLDEVQLTNLADTVGLSDPFDRARLIHDKDFTVLDRAARTEQAMDILGKVEDPAFAGISPELFPTPQLAEAAADVQAEQLRQEGRSDQQKHQDNLAKLDTAAPRMPDGLTPSQGFNEVQAREAEILGQLPMQNNEGVARGTRKQTLTSWNEQLGAMEVIGTIDVPVYTDEERQKARVQAVIEMDYMDWYTKFWPNYLDPAGAAASADIFISGDEEAAAEAEITGAENAGTQ